MIEERRIKRLFRFSVDTDPEISLAIFTSLVETGQEIFADTSFLAGGPITAEDVERIRIFYKITHCLNPDVFNQSTQDHLYLTSQYAVLLGQKFNQQGYNFNLYELEALGLLHDLGRTFSHRKGRNERVADFLMRKIGFTPEFMAGFCPDEAFIPRGFRNMGSGEIDQLIMDPASTTQTNPRQGIILMADLLGKRRKDGALRRWSDVTKVAHFTAHYEDDPDKWPSEKLRWQESTRPGHKTAVNSLYKSLGSWVRKITKQPLDQVVQEMESKLI